MPRSNPYIVPCSFMAENGMITDTLVKFVLWVEQATKELEEEIKSITKLDKTNSKLNLLKQDCITQMQVQFNWYIRSSNINTRLVAIEVYNFIISYPFVATCKSCYLIDNCTDGNLAILLPMIERIQNGPSV